MSLIFSNVLFYFLIQGRLVTGAGYVASYNGTGVSMMATTDNLAFVQILRIINSDLYIGGNFLSMNGEPVNRIARFGC